MTLFRKALLRTALATSLLAATALAVPAQAQDMPAIDVMELTIADIHAAYATGTFTAEQLVQAYLDRIAMYEETYNAFVWFNPDALADARAIDAARAAGEPLGPLAGIPLAVKEAYDVAGAPSTVGWAPLAPEVGGIALIPETDAPIVARLRAAGAIILGKTNIPAFSGSASNANSSWAGPTFNAHGLDFIPGGSSTGSATAVSGNLTVLATAEETSGSITAPAGYQGIVGLKPTFGLTPNVGIAPIGGSTRDVGSVFARTVMDEAIAFSVIAGYTPEDPKTLLSVGNMPENGDYTSLFGELTLDGARIGLFGPGFRSNRELEEETAALYAAAIAQFMELGAVTVDDPFEGTGFNELSTNGGGINFSFGYDFNQFLARLGPSAIANSNEELTPYLPADQVESGRGATIVMPGSSLPPDPEATADAIADRLALLETMEAVFTENDLDLLVFPFSAGEGTGAIPFPIINIAGSPALIIPAGEYESGMPFSLALLGLPWSEAELLAYAYDYEEAFPGRVPPELIVSPPAPAAE